MRTNHAHHGHNFNIGDIIYMKILGQELLFIIESFYSRRGTIPTGVVPKYYDYLKDFKKMTRVLQYFFLSHLNAGIFNPKNNSRAKVVNLTKKATKEEIENLMKMQASPGFRETAIVLAQMFIND